MHSRGFVNYRIMFSTLMLQDEFWERANTVLGAGKASRSEKRGVVKDALQDVENPLALCIDFLKCVATVQNSCQMLPHRNSADSASSRF